MRRPPSTRNAALEKPAVQDPPKETTLKDLHTNPLVTSKVEQFLSQLDDSSSEESEVEDKTKTKSTRGRRHALRSGKASKLTSRVVNPQLWPHSHLSLLYVSKDKKYDLTLAEFAAGYTAILQRPTLWPRELRARIVHLSSLMYLATQFIWSSVRDFHVAVLFEIECGRADWGDSFTHLETRILQAPVKPSSRAGGSRTEGSSAVFFCWDFQHGASKFNKDHYGTLRGERKWLQHIWARCWVDTRFVACHTEFSKECPLAVEKDSNSSGTAAPWLELPKQLNHNSLCLQDSRPSSLDSRLGSCSQDSVSSVEDKCYLDSRLSEVVHSDYGSESAIPSLSSQVTALLVINENFHDVCLSLPKTRLFSSQIPLLCCII